SPSAASNALPTSTRIASALHHNNRCPTPATPRLRVHSQRASVEIVHHVPLADATAARCSRGAAHFANAIEFRATNRATTPLTVTIAWTLLAVAWLTLATVSGSASPEPPLRGERLPGSVAIGGSLSAARQGSIFERIRGPRRRAILSR